MLALKIVEIAAKTLKNSVHLLGLLFRCILVSFCGAQSGYGQFDYSLKYSNEYNVNQ